jgi:hypothetical protein
VLDDEVRRGVLLPVAGLEKRKKDGGRLGMDKAAAWGFRTGAGRCGLNSGVARVRLAVSTSASSI